jgi:hypothetical protein
LPPLTATAVLGNAARRFLVTARAREPKKGETRPNKQRGREQPESSCNTIRARAPKPRFEPGIGVLTPFKQSDQNKNQLLGLRGTGARLYGRHTPRRIGTELTHLTGTTSMPRVSSSVPCSTRAKAPITM